MPGDEVSDETELENVLWPLNEKREATGETGVEVEVELGFVAFVIELVEFAGVLLPEENLAPWI